MSAASGIDWEDAFANGSYIEGADDFPGLWTERAEFFRRAHPGAIDLPYGDAPRERFDLFKPEGAPKGLFVFVHGGYWQAFDKTSWSHLAAGPLSHGWAVAIPSYTLAPEVGLPDITAQIGRAVSAAAELVEGPIRLSGHSAGGHLVSRMACQNGPLAPEIADRLERVISISGLHDLRPLMLHSMNEKLGLTTETALTESAALNDPLPGVKVTSWVGALERPEFLRQSALLAENWGRAGLETEMVADHGKHHFNVIDGIGDPEHPLCHEIAGA